MLGWSSIQRCVSEFLFPTNKSGRADLRSVDVSAIVRELIPAHSPSLSFLQRTLDEDQSLRLIFAVPNVSSSRGGKMVVR